MAEQQYLQPQTAAEWQEAVDLAEFFLCVDAARNYGLVKGGPPVDVSRCEEILAEGKRRGTTPTKGCVERLTRAFKAGGG